MTASSFAVALALAAALLALWVDQRFEAQRPASLTRMMTHGLLALVAGQGVVPLVVRLLASPDASAARRAATVLVIFLPSMIYMFLATLWLLRRLADSATRVNQLVAAAAGSESVFTAHRSTPQIAAGEGWRSVHAGG